MVVFTLVIWLAGAEIKITLLGDFSDRLACEETGKKWVISVDQWSPNLSAGYGCLPREIRK